MKQELKDILRGIEYDPEAKIELVNYVLSELMGTVDLDDYEKHKKVKQEVLSSIFAKKGFVTELKGRMIRLIKTGAIQTKNMEEVFFNRGRILELQTLLRDMSIAFNQINAKRGKSPAVARSNRRTGANA